MSTGFNFMLWWIEEDIKGDKFELLAISHLSTFFPSHLSKAEILSKPVYIVYQRDPRLACPLDTRQDRVMHNFSGMKIPRAIPLRTHYFQFVLALQSNISWTIVKYLFPYNLKKILGALFKFFPIFNIRKLLFIIGFHELHPVKFCFCRASHTFPVPSNLERDYISRNPAPLPTYPGNSGRGRVQQVNLYS